MKRNILIAGIALFAFLGSVVTGWKTTAERDLQLRGYTDASRSADLPYRVPLLGVNADLFQYDSSQLHQQLIWMEQAQITWVRQFVRWDELEPQPEQYDWQSWDALAAELRQHPNLRIVAVLCNSPQWARLSKPTVTHTAPPDNPDDFAAFAAAFAVRYGDIVDTYEIWDEPNLQIAWGGQEPRPIDYAALLTAAYPAIHQSDSGAIVITGGLAPTTETGPANINELNFLKALYQAGAQDSFDAVGTKPYGFDVPPLERTLRTDQLNFNRVILLREEMVKRGDGRKAIWASAWGWNHLPENWEGSPSIWGSVSAEQQVAYTLDALARAEREWPWMGGMILQHWQTPVAQNDPLWGFSVIAPDNHPGSLWSALAQRPRMPYAENGLFAAANPYTRYSGVWTLGPMGADIGWLKDSHLAFNFAGSDVSVLARKDDYVAYLYPSIDGGSPNATPQDSSGHAYIVLTSGSLKLETSLIPIARNLSATAHTLEIIADRGWDHWAIVGFGVSTGNLTADYDQIIQISILATLITGLATLISLWPLLPQINLTPLRPLMELWGMPLGIITSISLMFGMLLSWGDSLPNLFRRDPLPLGLAILSAGLLQLQPGLLLAIISALILFIILYHRPDIGLTVTLLWAPFFLFPVNLYRFAFPVTEILILLTATSRLLRGIVVLSQMRTARVSLFPIFTKRQLISNLRGIDIWVLLWVLLGCTSVLWSEQRTQAITELRVLFVEPALFYILFRSLRPNLKLAYQLVDALLVSGIIVATIGLWQFTQGQAIITAEEGARRLASVYGSPNNVALYLGRCIPFFIAFVLVPITRWRRVFGALALIPIGLAFILTQSVGGIFIGLPAVITALLLLLLGRKAILPLGGLVLVTIVCFGIAAQSPRFARALNFDSGTNFYRLRAWESALNMIADHPITGLGLDQFLYAYRGHYIRPDAWQEPNLSHPHNIFLDFWIRLGLGGVALLVAILVILVRNLKRVFHPLKAARSNHRLLWALLIGIIGCLVNVFAHGLIDNSIYVQDQSYVWMLLLALTSWLSNRQAIDGVDRT